MLRQTQCKFAEDSRYYQVRIIMFRETLPEFFFLKLELIIGLEEESEKL